MNMMNEMETTATTESAIFNLPVLVQGNSIAPDAFVREIFARLKVEAGIRGRMRRSDLARFTEAANRNGYAVQMIVVE